MAFAFARQAPAGGFNMPQRQAAGPSPMARMAVGSTPTPGAPNQRIGTGKPGANPMSNQFQYTPQQYNQDVESSFDTQLGQNAKEAAMAQQTAENYGMSVQRRNASNAAIGGYSVGGGGFLAGQTNALLSGQDNASQLALGFNKNATDIEARRADYRAGIDSKNLDNANKYAYDDWVYNRGRTDTLADRQSDADATNFGNKVSTAVSSAMAGLGQYGIQLGDKNSGVGWAEVAPLIDAMKNAKTPAELAQAQAAYDAWVTKRAAARKAYQSGTNGAGSHYYQNEADYLKSQGW